MSSQALVRFDARPLQPHSQSILRRVIALEAIVLLANHPHQIRDILGELHLIVAFMSAVCDWILFPRVTILILRARDISFRLCQALIHHCSVLIDACDMADCTRTLGGNIAYETSYDEVARAVQACDDVLCCMVPSAKSFYCEQLRPRLVSIMDYLNVSDSECSFQSDNESASPVKLVLNGSDAEVTGSSETDDSLTDVSCDSSNSLLLSPTSSSETVDADCAVDSLCIGRHTIRLCWMTDNILFEYDRFTEVTCGSSKSSLLSPTSSDVSQSISASSIVCDRLSGSSPSKRRRYTSPQI
jgi:hypothetical protein